MRTLRTRTTPSSVVAIVVVRRFKSDYKPPNTHNHSKEKDAKSYKREEIRPEKEEAVPYQRVEAGPDAVPEHSREAEDLADKPEKPRNRPRCEYIVEHLCNHGNRTEEEFHLGRIYSIV